MKRHIGVCIYWLKEEKTFIKEKTVGGKVDIRNREARMAGSFMAIFMGKRIVRHEKSFQRRSSNIPETQIEYLKGRLPNGWITGSIQQ